MELGTPLQSHLYFFFEIPNHKLCHWRFLVDADNPISVSDSALERASRLETAAAIDVYSSSLRLSFERASGFTKGKPGSIFCAADSSARARLRSPASP